MRFISLFSGIEAASVAWEPIGWECVAFAEIEPMPCQLLRERWPHVPNLGDVTQITLDRLCELGDVDVVIFGSPCQDLSLAGNRKGLAGERSGLFIDAMRIVRWLRAYNALRWALWENVFGAFSSNEGRDFAVVVAEMAGSPVDVPKKGWRNEGAFAGEKAFVEWSTLDAQWFGVAQRRRRVFALADFGDWTSRPPVLLEPESVRGDSAPSRQSREDIAGTLTRGVGERGAEDGERGLLLQVVSNAEGTLELPYITASNLAKQANNQQPLIAYMPARTFGKDGGIDEHFAEREVADALHTAIASGNKAPLIAWTGDGVTADPISANEARTYTHEGITMRMHNCVQFEWKVRRFMPIECERLQGFPDNWTAGHRRKDAPRYKALGNSMAVPVINWIGRSIEAASWDIWS